MQSSTRPGTRSTAPATTRTWPRSPRWGCRSGWPVARHPGEAVAEARAVGGRGSRAARCSRWRRVPVSPRRCTGAVAGRAAGRDARRPQRSACLADRFPVQGGPGARHAVGGGERTRRGIASATWRTCGRLTSAPTGSSPTAARGTRSLPPQGRRAEDTVDRKCLCNALMANIGLGQLLRTATRSSLRSPSGRTWTAPRRCRPCIPVGGPLGRLSTGCCRRSRTGWGGLTRTRPLALVSRVGCGTALSVVRGPLRGPSARGSRQVRGPLGGSPTRLRDH